MIGSAGTLNSGGGITVSAGVLNINGAYINSGAGMVSVASGVLNFNGTATINGTTSEVWVGNGSSGTMNMSGGSLAFNSSGPSGGLPSGGCEWRGGPGRLAGW